jgi:isopenicillin-N epimerase
MQNPFKELWGLDPSIVFLNHGSFGATPKSILSTQARWRSTMEEDPVYFMTELAPSLIRNSAERLAQFLHTSADQLVFVENATTGVNAVLRSLLPILRPSDEILTTSHVYGAVWQTLQYLRDSTGVRLVTAEVPFPIAHNDEVISAVKSAITPSTKLVVIDHITSPTGILFPIEEIIRFCKELDIYTLIDGAHAPGNVPLNLDELQPNWYTGNCHKWMCAPKGTAFLWSSPEMAPFTHPTIISHNYKQGFINEFDWIGTRDITSILCIPDVLDLIEEWGGVETITQKNKELLLKGRAILTNTLGIEAPADEAFLTTMATLPLPFQMTPSEEAKLALNKRLRKERSIQMPYMPFNGKMWFRISSFLYNTEDEYQYLAESLPTLFGA